MSNPPHWLTSAELTEALQYAHGSLRLTAAIVMAREALAEIQRLRVLLAEVWYVAQERPCNARRSSSECHCDRLRQIGEMESIAAKGAS